MGNLEAKKIPTVKKKQAEEKCRECKNLLKLISTVQILWRQNKNFDAADHILNCISVYKLDFFSGITNFCDTREKQLK